VSTLDDYGEPLHGDELNVGYVLRLLSSGQGRPVKILGKTVGHIYVTKYGRLYVTRRSGSELFRRFNSFGISDGVLRVVASLGAEKVMVVYEGESLEVYVSDIAQWLTEAITYWWAEGHELQRHLPISSMRRLPHSRVEASP
jgi:hypothetical protein